MLTLFFPEVLQILPSLRSSARMIEALLQS